MQLFRLLVRLATLANPGALLPGGSTAVRLLFLALEADCVASPVSLQGLILANPTCMQLPAMKATLEQLLRGSSGTTALQVACCILASVAHGLKPDSQHDVGSCGKRCLARVKASSRATLVAANQPQPLT